MPEHFSNKDGYLMLAKQTDKDIPVKPTITMPLRSEGLVTNSNMDIIDIIVGNNFDAFDAIQGQRGHVGDVQFLAEPNSAGYIFDSLLKKGTTTGSDPYTHPFEHDGLPNGYTYDIRRGLMVARYWGVESRQINPDWDVNKMLLNSAVTARGAFFAAKITAVSTNVLTLDTTYSDVPTKGLVDTDLIRIINPTDMTYVDTTLTSHTDNAVTVGAAGAAAIGHLVCIRPATPSLSMRAPFMWSRTQFFLADDASTALAGNQTRLEKGSTWTIFNNVETEEGQERSGSIEKAGVVRTSIGATAVKRQYFDNPNDYQRYMNVDKSALVIRHFSESNLELRVTLNKLAAENHGVNLDINAVIYHEQPLKALYNQTDGKGLSVAVINKIATI